MKRKHKALCKDHTQQNRNMRKRDASTAHNIRTPIFIKQSSPEGCQDGPPGELIECKGERGAESGTFTGSSSTRCACAPCKEQAGRLENRGAPVDSLLVPTPLLRIESGDPALLGIRGEHRSPKGQLAAAAPNHAETLLRHHLRADAEARNCEPRPALTAVTVTRRVKPRPPCFFWATGVERVKTRVREMIPWLRHRFDSRTSHVGLRTPSGVIPES